MGNLKSIVERHYRDIADKNLEDTKSLFSPDVVTLMPGMEPLRGVEPFIGYAHAFTAAFPDLRIELRSSVEDGDTIAAEGLLRGTHTGPLFTPNREVPATGRAVEVPISDVFEVHDGLVTSHRVYFDQMTLMAQLGLVPEPTQA